VRSEGECLGAERTLTEACARSGKAALQAGAIELGKRAGGARLCLSPPVADQFDWTYYVVDSPTPECGSALPGGLIVAGCIPHFSTITGQWGRAGGRCERMSVISRQAGCRGWDMRVGHSAGASRRGKRIEPAGRWMQMGQIGRRRRSRRHGMSGQQRADHAGLWRGGAGTVAGKILPGAH